MADENKNSGEEKDMKDIFRRYAPGIIVCFLLPFLLFAILGAFLRERGCRYYLGVGATVGIVSAVVFVLFRSGKGKSIFESCKEEDSDLLDNLDGYSKRCYCEVKLIYNCRKNAAQRLARDEAWIQNTSIYYSVVTALMAVLGLVKDKSGFLTIPSVLFTVAVAILVTYANAQRCGTRSNDLSANCRDLGLRLDEVMREIGINPSNTQNKGSDEKNFASKEGYDNRSARLKECMEKFYNNLGDSEDHSVVDEWQYQDSWLFYVYCTMKAMLVGTLFLIPVLFVLTNWPKVKILLLLVVK